MIGSNPNLLQLQTLKLPNSLLKASFLRLQIRKSALLRLLYLHGDLLLIGGIIEDLALLVDACLCLLELLGGFGDLGVDVDAVFDVEEDGEGRLRREWRGWRRVCRRVR
jgi:hypothetical protein